MRTLFSIGFRASLPLILWSGACLGQTDHSPAPARAVQPTIAVKHFIPSAVQVKVSHRGGEYFQKNLTTMLGNLGVSFGDGEFPATNWRADKPVNFANLGLPPETTALVTKIRSLLSTWLVGFPLKDIRPGVDLGTSGYTAVFNRFALVADEKLLHQLGKNDGAVLAIELELKELDLNLSRVRAFDMNAQMLGQVGFDQVKAKVGGTTPIKLRLPFFVHINAKGQLEFEALKMTENFKQVDFELKYQKLVAPSIVLEVNGYRMEMSQAQLEKELQSNMPTILQKARGFLSEFASTKLPAILNQKAKEALQGGLEEVFRLSPPGAAEGEVVEPLLWGLKIERISQNNGLAIDLKAFVEDPKNPRLAPIEAMNSRGPVQMNDLAADQYDIAMSIDRGLINRILQLSFQRKLFEKISVGNGGILRLTDVPTVDFVVPPASALLNQGEAALKIHVKVRVPQDSVKGFNRLFLHDNFEVSFDLIAKLRKIPYKSGVEIVLIDIDTNSLWLNPDDITGLGSLFPAKVLSGVVDQLKTISAGWKTTEQKLPGTLPLPPEVLGIKLEINQMNLDSTGHLVMYLNYLQASGNPSGRR